MFTLNVRLAQMLKGHNIIKENKVLKQNADDIDWEVSVKCLGELGNILSIVKGVIKGLVYI